LDFSSISFGVERSLATATLRRRQHCASVTTETISKEAILLVVCATRSTRPLCSAVISSSVNRPLWGWLFQDPLELAHRFALDQIGGLHSFQCRCHCVSKRQRHGDDDYAKGNELDQIIWPFSVGVSITEETRSANAQRVGSFHVYCIPFTNEMTILMQQYGQLFGSTRWIAKVTPPSPCQTHENASAALF